MHRAEKFGDVVTADHKIHNEQSQVCFFKNYLCFKIWLLSGSNASHANQNLHKKRLTEVPRSERQSEGDLHRYLFLNWAKLARHSSGIFFYINTP